MLVEDVVTTGGALLESYRNLRAAGARVAWAVCAIDREQGGRENLATASIGLRCALTRHDLESAARP